MDLNVKRILPFLFDVRTRYLEQISALSFTGLANRMNNFFVKVYKKANCFVNFTD